jgi:zinc-ribbon domain
MLCSRCGAEVADGAAYCSRCGTPLGGSAGLGSMEHRREAAEAAFRAGSDPAGVQCPNCGRYRLQVVRIDADATLITGVVMLAVGFVAGALVLIFGDAGLLITDASEVAVVLMAAGVLLLLWARHRRRPRAFECFVCGYRVP